MDFLAFSAGKADAARDQQILILQEWNNHAQDTDKARRARIWRGAAKRVVNDGFIRPKPPSASSKASQRVSTARVKKLCKELLQLDENIEDLETFMTAL